MGFLTTYFGVGSVDKDRVDDFMNHLTASRGNSPLDLHISHNRLVKGVESLITALFDGPAGDLCRASTTDLSRRRVGETTVKYIWPNTERKIYITGEWTGQGTNTHRRNPRSKQNV